MDHPYWMQQGPWFMFSIMMLTFNLICPMFTYMSVNVVKL